MDKYKLEKLRAKYEESRMFYIHAINLGHPTESWAQDKLDAFASDLNNDREKYFAAIDEMSQKEGERE